MKQKKLTCRAAFPTVFHFVSPEPPANTHSTDEEGLSQLSLAKVASDLLYSILQQDSKVFNSCKAEIEKQGDKLFTNPCSLWKVLRKVIQDCQADPVYILIDGIDGLKGSFHRELIKELWHSWASAQSKYFSPAGMYHTSQIASPVALSNSLRSTLIQTIL